MDSLDEIEREHADAFDEFVVETGRDGRIGEHPEAIKRVYEDVLTGSMDKSE